VDDAGVEAPQSVINRRSRLERVVMPDLEITLLRSSPEIRAMLSEMLIEVVANGGSVSFMHPLEQWRADAFWDGSLAAADRDERVILGAWIDGELAGTVTLLLDLPPNQPHRGEIAKMMTRMKYRGRGVARALMVELERIAVARGRTMLTLDTASDEGASGLYEKLGFIYAGTLPDYALKPHGRLTGTMLYWKRIGSAAESSSVTSS
jgi:ribosomal protein S18 acetylase RimI-like enzyme